MDNFPNAPLHVYAVWTPILGRDTREGWEPTLLYDRRVTHYWDADNDVSRWMGTQSDFDDYPDPLVWDVYALYGPDARWDQVEQAPWPLEGFGWTVADRSANLAIAAIPLLEDWWRAFLPLGVAPRQPGDPRLLLAPSGENHP